MKINLHSLLSDTILSGITDHGTQTVLALVILSCGFILIATLVDLVLRRILINIVNKALTWTGNNFLAALADARVLNILSLFSIAIVFDIGSAFVSYKGDDSSTRIFATVLLNVAYALYYIVATWSLSRAIAAWNLYYERRFDSSHEYPIYGYIKMMQVIVWCVGIILYLTFTLNKSPFKMLTGIGAFSAFVILIFKDTFLGLVSSIQATANQIVKIGDWVNIPKYDIDGEVTFISISTVKVRNWDNTVTSIPTFALTTDAIHNWQSMVHFGARRIFRAIYLDVTSIRECDSVLLEKLSAKYSFVAELFAGMTEVATITNLAIFRLYMNDYLQKHRLLVHHKNLPTLVRYLPTTPHGLPLQIYAFSKEVYLQEYEEIQSQILEHVFLVLEDFDLNLYQSDVAGLPASK